MSEFENAARTQKKTGIVSEFWYFLGHSKKWWLLPIFAVLAIFGLLVFLSGTAVAPFIYSLF